MLLLRQHELYKFQIHVLPLPPANFVHVTPGQWADHNGVKFFLNSYKIPNFTRYFIRLNNKVSISSKHAQFTLWFWTWIGSWFSKYVVHCLRLYGLLERICNQITLKLMLAQKTFGPIVSVVIWTENWRLR